MVQKVAKEIKEEQKKENLNNIQMPGDDLILISHVNIHIKVKMQKKRDIFNIQLLNGKKELLISQ